MGIATDLIYITIAALVCGFLAQSLRQPLLIGYILAGIIVGPHTSGPTIERPYDIGMLAEIGVALLLFTLGLQFSFRELKETARVTFIGTPLQILLCTLISYALAVYLGFSSSDATWIGATVSLSSTMVVLKSLGAKNALGNRTSRVMLSILIAQDLAVIPITLILPQLAGDAVDFTSLLWAVVKSLLFLIGMFFTGTQVFPRLFAQISRLGSRELFFLTTLSVALGAGFISYKLGLSFALGAFVAGMILSETDFNHQALSDLMTLRDLFSLIFFVSVGMLFDPAFFLEHFKTICFLTLTIIVAKGIINGSVMSLFGYSRNAAITVGLGLSQVGEFAFVIARTGNQAGQLSSEAYSLMIAVAVVSMVLTPALFWISDMLIGATEDTEDTPASNLPSDQLSDHVIIIGGGVVGQYVAHVLSSLQKPCVVIEADYSTVKQLQESSISVLFGDASHRSMLESAHINAARLIVITVTKKAILLSILEELRLLGNAAPVVLRVAEVEDLEQLALYDPHTMVQPQLEAGLEFVRQSLLAIGHQEAEILGLLGQLRAQRYDPQQANAQTPLNEAQRIQGAQLLQFNWINVDDDTPLAGKPLSELNLRERFGISVAAALRDNKFIANPGPNFLISSGDVIGIIGTERQLKQFLAQA